MKKMHITAIFLAILFLIPSCNPAVDEDTPETVALTGVYTKTAMPLDESFMNIQAMLVDEESLYIAGALMDSEGSTQTIAVMNLNDLSVTYEHMPIKKTLTSIAIGEKGYFFLSASMDMNTFQQVYTLYCVENGELLWEKPIEDIITLSSTWSRIYIAAFGGQWYVGGDTTLVTIAADGAVVKNETMPAVISGMGSDADGLLHVWGSGFHYVSNENGTISNHVVWQQATDSLNANSTLYFASGYDYYYSNENGIFGCDIDGSEPVSMMNWVNSALLSSSVRRLVVASPETVFMYGSDGIGGETGLWKYTKSEDVALTEKQVIRVTYSEDGSTRVPLAAVKFNAAQSLYHVICEEYSSSYTGTDSIWDALDASILSGNVGDIIVTRSIDSLRKYGQRNLFTDLNTLMNDEFTADNIFGCVRQACSVNGKLYGIPQEFRLTTYAAKSDNLNSIEVWNTEAFIELDESLPEGRQLLNRMTRADVYNMLLNSVLTECIDFENGTCSFESDTFTKFLTYLASLPETVEDELEYGVNHYISDEVVLFYTDIGSYSSYAHMQSVFGENIEVIPVGYPSAEGGATRLSSDRFYSIMDSSSVKEGAMTFLRYLLSADCTIDEMRGMRAIPSLKTTMQAWNESEGLMYHYFYTNNIGRWSSSLEPITEEQAGEPGVCVAITQELIDEVYGFLDTVSVYPEIPQSIIDIVEEDMSAYLASGKTAEETAKVIQNRVSVYLSEQS